jgi:nucleoside-diphosphate-sugar epimerase
MRIAVTGATGFIGSALLEALIAAGHEVVAGTRGASPSIETPGVSWVTIDFNSDSNLAAFVADVDAVVNCASPTASEFAGATPEFTGVYLRQISRLAAAVAGAEVQFFLQISSAQVHGLMTVTGQGENPLPVQVSQYGLAHSQAEQNLEEILSESPTVLSIVRLSNAFGWNPDLSAGSWSLFVNQLILGAARGEAIQLHGSRKSKRDFIPVADVVTSILRMLNFADLQKLEGVWEIGSGVCRTLVEVVDTLQTQMPEQRSLDVEWSTEALANGLCVDISRAEQADLISRSDFATEIRHLFAACEAAVSIA